MRFIHYSAKPLGTIYSVSQDSNSEWKPRGLWVSVEDDWIKWCKAENYCLQNLKYFTEIIINKKSKILYLKNALDIDTFEKRFTLPAKEWQVKSINWIKIASKYHGIIIAPYVWERRLSSVWYYAWDCASGCIWDANAISKAL